MLWETCIPLAGIQFMALLTTGETEKCSLAVWPERERELDIGENPPFTPAG